MVTSTSGLAVLSHHLHALSHHNHAALSPHTHAALCPPPLHIQKRPRRSSVRRSLFRTSSHTAGCGDEVYGPLDDIIDEITGDIWRLPPAFTLDSSLLEWPNPLKASATWTVTTLPVSRIPSDVPLTIRKQRHSRSAASGSSYSNAMSNPRNPSENQPGDAVGVSPSSILPDASWPELEPSVSQPATEHERESLDGTDYNNQLPARQNIRSLFRKSDDPIPSESRSGSQSRLRKLTNALPPLLRRGTGNSIESSGTASKEGTAMSVVPSNAIATSSDTESELLGDCAPDAESRNRLSMSEEIMAIMPPSPEYNSGLSSGAPPEPTKLPTTLSAAIRIVPEFEILTSKDYQDLWVAVEVEGVLHNRCYLPDPTLDIVIVIDNGKESKDEIRDMMKSIRRYGPQKWNPPRPNPSITDTIVAVAKSLEIREPKDGKLHIMLLSPALGNVHGVTKTHPGLHIHQINPAIIPIRCKQNLDTEMCSDSCCANFTVHNWNHYQPIPGLLNQIIRYARSEPPVSEVTDVLIKFQPSSGCQILKVEGYKFIRRLRPGQTHAVFMHIRVTRSKTQEIDLENKDPVLQSSLSENNGSLRQELLTARAMGASKVHLMTIQLLNQDSMDEESVWRFRESSLFIFKEMGKLARPADKTVDFYKRLAFYVVSHAETNEANEVIKKLERHVKSKDPALKKNFERLRKEVGTHKEIARYEKTCRGTLPRYPGSAYIPAAHDWIVDRCVEQ
ncbi:hypothetical protein K505DRAFT_318426 [Melanomma pulvis-pyrius CBS 109.77]|uniref:Uncharacterized protein n=1 Tax=Melanomma pulvis-pyrius CBS 109.77 TaxID=1314802 RepID=A0A6A6WQU6_9PLEO|nr:hypothetical protein K505DRAFT_318426 [Melanomma pulvis-pyrius CBS 109.77]